MPEDHRPPRILILGTGFAAVSFVKDIHLKHYEVIVVAPRNYFLFTPLLPSTTVGTLEFRSIIEPIRTARRGVQFYQGYCVDVDTERNVARCEGIFKRTPFEIAYDYLVIAVGAESSTFNIPGVKEHAHFLKEIPDARAIRHGIVQCFERAIKPGRTPSDYERLLHFVIVGGGPTGVEFAAELSDFLEEDLQRIYPDLIPYVRITLVEAGSEILTAFDRRLREYTRARFARNRIQVRTKSLVKEVRRGEILLDNGETISFGLLVWSTGNGPTPLAHALPFPKERGRILVDTNLRVKGHENIFAAGDCSVTESAPLPQTAQVALQEGKYLARYFNARAKGRDAGPFAYRHMGMMVYIGDNRALADLGNWQGRGFTTWLLWRSAYLTRLVSLKNKFKVALDWLGTMLFGRDISQF